MVQGDKYSLPLKIQTKTETSIDTITPNDITKLRVKIGVIEDYYPNGTIVYDTATRRWKVPLTQAQTLAMSNDVPIQVRLIFSNGDICNSKILMEPIERAIIKEVEPNG